MQGKNANEQQKSLPPKARPSAPGNVLAGMVPKGVSGIAAQLRQAIIEGVYATGDRLPAERDIAKSLGASRTTVRNALRMLEESELVRRKVGSGTFVLHGVREERGIAEVTSPLELIDVRLAIEPQIVRMAILHGTGRDMESMSEILAQLERTGTDREQFTKLDVSFHLSLASATHNPLLIWIYRQINAVRSHAQWNVVKDKVLTRDRIEEYNVEHRAIYEALRTRDAEAAVGLITRHLGDARRDLVGSLR